MAYYLDTDVTYLKGIGPKWGDKLHRMGFRTIKDLIEFYPRTYEDRRQQRTIQSLQSGERVYVCGEIVRLQVMGQGPRQKYHIMTIKDDTGFLFCKFFRIPFRTYFEKFHTGQKVLLFGQVHIFQGRKEFHHPEMTLMNEVSENPFLGLLPIYTEGEGLSSKKMQKWIQFAIENLEQNPEIKDLKQEFEFLPDWLRSQFRLKNRFLALKDMHTPDPNESEKYFAFRSSAHQRFIFDEFFWLELYLLLKKQNEKNEPAYIVLKSKNYVEKFLQNLPFELTGDQKKSYAEICNDLASGQPMSRLLQGDVGSGKTAVIFMSVLAVIESGLQAALMAPTEILAEQHYQSAKKLMESIGVKVVLLTSQIKASEKKQIIDDILNNKINFVIGTHALIEDYVQFAKLGLVVVDEQHRFGVEQRQKLKNKSAVPHFLMVTATPIPRTLAMTAYGDLDVSLLREKPPGRTPIQTRLVRESQRASLLTFLWEQVQKGRQAYIIYPLVEESEKMPLKDVVTAFKNYSTQYDKIKWGLLHGQMNGDEKQKIMDQFRKSEIQVLLSTTVVEVGVDVPNANLIIIEHAERFGLSQLHQLRGRVGRGQLKGFCALIASESIGKDSWTRLQKLEMTTDGFELAEWDLQWRGAGELLGKRQSGLAGFKIADLNRDAEILELARSAVEEVIRKDPQLNLAIHKKLKKQIELIQQLNA